MISAGLWTQSDFSRCTHQQGCLRPHERRALTPVYTLMPAACAPIPQAPQPSPRPAALSSLSIAVAWTLCMYIRTLAHARLYLPNKKSTRVVSVLSAVLLQVHSLKVRSCLLISLKPCCLPVLFKISHFSRPRTPDSHDSFLPPSPLHTQNMPLAHALRNCNALRCSRLTRILRAISIKTRQVGKGSVHTLERPASSRQSA